jgi:acetylornithine deacetylase/succinyl-diaminopimelate desuccinylase-like protein
MSCPAPRYITPILILLLAVGGHATAAAPASGTDAAIDEGRALLRELIEIDTTPGHGSTTRAAEAMAAHFRSAGFPAQDVEVVGSAARKGNLLVRLRGRGERAPILLMAHLDVVAALREDWNVDPFKLTERDGYFYGRGTLDVKGGAAGLVGALLRLHRDGIKPRGDYILALTAGEEDGVDNGIEWLLQHRPDAMRVAYALNVDGGGPEIRHGKAAVLSVETAEKVYLSYSVTARHPGGHSSLPGAGNPVYRLAAGLHRLADLQFPLRSNPTTRAYFGALADLHDGQLAEDMRAVARNEENPEALSRLAASSLYNNAQLRTTCVPTLLSGGHAENALPQQARATINCRLLPDEPFDEVDQRLRSALADPELELRRIAEPTPSPAGRRDEQLFTRIEAVAAEIWGPIPARAYMSAGATDAVYLRALGTPVYVFSGIAYDVDDDRSHGQDERILVASYDQSLEFLYRLLKSL